MHQRIEGLADTKSLSAMVAAVSNAAQAKQPAREASMKVVSCLSVNASEDTSRGGSQVNSGAGPAAVPSSLVKLSASPEAVCTDPLEASAWRVAKFRTSNSNLALR